METKIKKDWIKKDFIEELADLEHQQWSHLAKYLIDLVEDDKSVYEKLEDWKSLAHTDYNKLSEEDKEKDRVWAKKVVKLIEDKIERLEKEHNWIMNVSEEKVR